MKGDPGHVRFTGNGLKDLFLNACAERGPDGQPTRTEHRRNVFAAPTTAEPTRRSEQDDLERASGRASHAQALQTGEDGGRSPSVDPAISGAPTPDPRPSIGPSARDLRLADDDRPGRTS